MIADGIALLSLAIWAYLLIAHGGFWLAGERDDVVQPFQLETARVRGRFVRLGGVLDSILAPHGYPAEVAALLAESITMASALASGLKYDGIFTLQTRGDGPVPTMVTDVTSGGGLRGYARFDATKLNNATRASHSPVPRLLGAGHMAFTVDQGPDTERYQGITELTGATLADCAHNYFRRSEQLETAFMLFAEARADASGVATGARGGALMLQHLPTDSPSGSAESHGRDEDEDEAWRRAVILMSTLSTGEMLDPSLAPTDILYRLFHQEGLLIHPPKRLVRECRCSRQKVTDTLRMIPRREIAEMSDDGLVTVTCEFCKSDYVFNDAQMDAVYAESP